MMGELAVWLLWVASVCAVVLGVLIVFRYDWRKASDYGLRKADPPSLRLVLGFGIAVALAVALWWSTSGRPGS